MCPVLWDVQLNPDNGEVIYYYDRHSSKFVDQLLVTGIKELGGGASFSLRKIPAGAYLVEAVRDGHKAMSAIMLR